MAGIHLQRGRPRTRRKIDGIETRQIYGMERELLAEYAVDATPATPQKEYGYRNGQLLITASHLVGSWKFDENTGTTSTDAAGNGNTGTLMSGAGWTAGQSAAAVNLDGVNDYVKIKDGKISTATTGTISNLGRQTRRLVLKLDHLWMFLTNGRYT
jgi:hypothetical protein